MVEDAGIGIVEARETHISQLLFTSDRVYKLLKPVVTSFISFADADDRIAAARAEFELNRRFSPDVYLGTADVTENDRLVDCMVVMRRLPDDRQLTRLLLNDEGAGIDDCLRLTAKLVARIHADAPPLHGPQAEVASAGTIESLWEDNFETLAPLVDSVLDVAQYERIRTRAGRYLAGRRTLLAERIDHGWVRAGHGDLRAEHVFCLDDGPRLIDALAFREDFRVSDVLNDIAFLAMDLHRVAGAGAAARLMQFYAEYEHERHPATLAHFYVAYRAHVRAKIAAIRLGQGDPAARRQLLEYHDLADQHLDVGQVRMILVGGGVGTGKSTVSEGLARRLGLTWLRTDEIRQTAGGTVDYSDRGRDRVYEEMLSQAGRLLERGESVVLDATWSHERWRQQARELGRRLSVTTTELECRLPQARADERLLARRRHGHDPSEATIQVAHQLAAQFEPWSAARPVSTDRQVEKTVDDACRVVARPRPQPGLSYESIQFFLRRATTLVPVFDDEVERG